MHFTVKGVKEHSLYGDERILGIIMVRTGLLLSFAASGTYTNTDDFDWWGMSQEQERARLGIIYPGGTTGGSSLAGTGQGDMDVDSGRRPPTVDVSTVPVTESVKRKMRLPWALSPESLAAAQISAVPGMIREALTLAVEARQVPPYLVEKVVEAMIEPLRDDNPGFIRLLNDEKLLDKEVAGMAALSGWTDTVNLHVEEEAEGDEPTDYGAGESELSNTEKWSRTVERNSIGTENTSLRPESVSNYDDGAVIGGIQDVEAWGNFESTMLFYPCDETVRPSGKAETLRNDRRLKA